MATIFHDADADPSLIRARRVAVIGYGSQGHAHALNLRDSGVDVRVGLRPSSASRAAAEEQGLRVLDTVEAAAEADTVVLLAPDTSQKGIWESGLREAMSPGDALIFGHGLSIRFGLIEPSPDIDVLLVAPKSPGHIARRTYEQGQGVPGLVAVHQDPSGTAQALGISYASALGLTRAGVLLTTFAEEAETDLFGEQAVLCGGVSSLIQAGFETLVEAGYQPEAAYFECLHEVKLIVDMIYEGGLSWMRYSVSDTAEYGDYLSGPRVINESSREAMRGILADIRDGGFARRLMEEVEQGGQDILARRRAGRDHQIERVGRELRAMMPFIETPEFD
jgi:ketol-acid reductoisomerase